MNNSSLIHNAYTSTHTLKHKRTFICSATLDFTLWPKFGWSGIFTTASLCPSSPSLRPSKYCLGQYSKLYMIAVSYFEDRTIVYGICALLGYFDHESLKT